MIDETIHVNSDAVSALLSKLDKNIANYEKAASSMSKDFNAVTAKNLYKEGIRIINNKINNINNKTKRYKSVVKKYTDQYFMFDNLAAKNIDELLIPNNFDINDTFEENIFDKVILNKQDGLSVNNGDNNATTIVDNGFAYQNVLGKKLDNINNENIQEEKRANDIVGIEKENVNNVKNENKQEEQIYDERSSIYNNTLNKINNNVSISFDDYLKDIIDNQIFNDDKFVVKKGE